MDFGEEGVGGVVVELTGTDLNSRPVGATATSNTSGYYSFDNLLPGNYTVAFVGGGTGTLTSGSPNHWDVSLIPGSGATSSTNNFALTPGAGDVLKKGQTAGIGFWHNQNGQALINSLNGSSTSGRLGGWLAGSFPRMFANMAGKTNAEVADTYQQVFAYKGEKDEAQFFATALSIYATSSILSNGTLAASYGFSVTQDGARSATFNVGSNGRGGRRGQQHGVDAHGLHDVAQLPGDGPNQLDGGREPVPRQFDAANQGNQPAVGHKRHRWDLGPWARIPQGDFATMGNLQ